MIVLFPNKLYRMLCDSKCTGVTWGSEGGHLILNTREFEDQLLEDTPLRQKYMLKTTSITSFIRQLHAYGFKKVFDVAEKYGQDPSFIRRYFHPFFQLSKPELLCFMKRNVRCSTPSSSLSEQAIIKFSKDQHQSSFEPGKVAQPFMTSSALKPGSQQISSTSSFTSFYTQKPIPVHTLRVPMLNRANKNFTFIGTPQTVIDELVTSGLRKNKRKAQPRRHPSFGGYFGANGDGPRENVSNSIGEVWTNQQEVLATNSGFEKMTMCTQAYSASDEPTLHMNSCKIRASDFIAGSADKEVANQEHFGEQQEPLDLTSSTLSKVTSSASSTSCSAMYQGKNYEQTAPRFLFPPAACIPYMTTGNSFAPSPSIQQVPISTVLQPAFIAWPTQKVYCDERKGLVHPRPYIVPLPMSSKHHYFKQRVSPTSAAPVTTVPAAVSNLQKSLPATVKETTSPALAPAPHHADASCAHHLRATTQSRDVKVEPAWSSEVQRWRTSDN